MNRIARFWLPGLFILLLHSAAAQPADRALFFKVAGKELKDTSYLFGTFHIIRHGFVPPGSVVWQALEKSSGVVVEIVMDPNAPPPAVPPGMMAEKLTDLLPPAFADSLNDETKAVLDASLEELNHLKPVNLGITLSIVELMKRHQEKLATYTGELIDLHFAATGKQQGKTVTPLETIEEQMGLLFDDQPVQKQAEQLQQQIRRKKELLPLGDSLLMAWLNQDLARMNEIYLETLRLTGEEDRLVRDRNNRWMQKLPLLMQQGPQFVAVGALHLGGEHGLVHQLRKQGYTVIPVNF